MAAWKSLDKIGGLSKTSVVLTLVAVAMLSTFLLYYWGIASRTLSESEDLHIEEVNINRKTSTLTGVTLKNLGSKPISVIRAEMTKVQTGILLCSSTISPPIVINQREIKIISLSFPLAPEGADYKIVAVTLDNTAASYTFGYP